MKRDTTAPTVHLKDYRPPAYLIDRVNLDISLDPTRTEVKSRLSVRANPKAAVKRGPLQLDGQHLELGDIKLNGRALTKKDYKLTDTSLTLTKPPVKPFTLEITTYINPDANKALSGIYRSNNVYCSQCEAQGFRRITYFLDRPDVLATYTVRLEADPAAAPVLLSNGNLQERGMIDGGARHYAIWHDPHPKPSYLFAVVGGDLAPISSTFHTMSGRKVDLAIYVEHGKEGRAAWAMDALKRSMKWDEERFGREYDLDVFNIVAVSDFNLGAMENKGLNIFNDRLVLASPETATDTIFEAIESVIAHEYFHNWTGNRITCRDWFQLCLKEGLTVFRDQEFSSDERSRTVQRIVDVRQLKTHQFAEDAGPLAHPVRPESFVEINNFYTATVYEKGAELVRMIATILGADDFRKGMDLYFDRHDGEAATVDQFLTCFEDASGIDLSQFKLWYSQAGTPEVIARLSYNKNRKTADLELEQIVPPTPGQPNKKPMHIPVRVGLLGANGHDIDLKLEDGSTPRDGVIDLTKRRQRFRFVDVPSQPVPSLLRGFSAPVNITVDLPDTDIELLMAADSDQFNRWQAANSYAAQTLVEAVRNMAAGKRASGRGLRYARALGAALIDGDLEPAYRAELLKLPTQADVARIIGKDVDPALIQRAHRQLSKLVGRTLGPQLEDLYRRMAVKGPFSPDAASAGKRALRNAALTLLTARGSEDDIKRLARHYAKATNMTDRAHALHLLAAKGGTEAKAALADFYDTWHDDNVVIDTWFAVQAQSPLNSTITRVRALTQHPLFSLTAPNKVRALVGTFAAGNPVQFNRPDGAGYAFLVDQVLALDRLNPQIAARMLGALRSWRSLESERRAKARKALQRIARTKSLSSDVQEIASRILDG
ncbi:aminopeptidase N [Hyphomicrobium sulfonivorans]|uniref:aminopeptidase N n=1 Tax=Hyphomicrobium sulfonivorans TaxID=121290 RepID=UPI00156E6273|nr:aminopeptidase N [Hyphomicrobium sulfonivorans]MBI1650801.1 aminopeptidase N [Hyphomicrobium sulfonivorans]NSL71843.1 aminopeptidase N [Hyphomicrobium sulfonivorans]